MKNQKFQVVFQKYSKLDSGFFVVPFSVQEVYGKKSGVKVKVKIKGIEHRGFLMPQGDGTHCMGLKKELREKMKLNYGDKITVSMQEDTKERTVEIPEELNSAFNKNKSAKNFFDSLSFTNRKEYADWIVSSKKEETRRERLFKTIDMLNKGKKNPYDM